MKDCGHNHRIFSNIRSNISNMKDGLIHYSFYTKLGQSQNEGKVTPFHGIDKKSFKDPIYQISSLCVF